VTHHGEGRRGEGEGVGVAETGDELLTAGERIPPGEGGPGDGLHLPRPVQHHVQSPELLSDGQLSASAADLHLVQRKALGFWVQLLVWSRGFCSSLEHSEGEMS